MVSVRTSWTFFYGNRPTPGPRVRPFFYGLNLFCLIAAAPPGQQRIADLELLHQLAGRQAYTQENDFGPDLLLSPHRSALEPALYASLIGLRYGKFHWGSHGHQVTSDLPPFFGQVAY